MVGIVINFLNGLFYDTVKTIYKGVSHFKNLEV